MTATISTADLRAALKFTGEAAEHPDPAAFRTGILPGLRELVDSDVIAYNEVDVGDGSYVCLDEPVGALPPAIAARLPDLAHEHPVLVCNHAGDLDPYTISDFLSARAFHRLAIYEDIFRPLEAEDQLSFGLPGEVVIGIAMNRSSRSFTERDKGLMALIQPHLTGIWQRVRERERAAALIDALERGFDEDGCAAILLDARRRIEHSSELAAQLLEAYGTASGLPSEVRAWLESGCVGSELTIEGPRGSLRIRALPRPGAPGALTLLLRERRTGPPAVEDLAGLGLSRREAQVLRLVARGADNDAIAAELAITPSTVRKHLERIYGKLGVHSRTEAAARALGALPPA